MRKMQSSVGPNMDDERRRAPRHPFVAAAEVEDVAVGSRLPTRVSDLSVGGCYVDTVNPFPAGTEVRVKILTMTQQFEANLPGLSKPIRILTRSDAEVFLCRWTIRDRDPELKSLLREMQRANSAATTTIATLRLKQALKSRGLLGRVDEFV